MTTKSTSILFAIIMALLMTGCATGIPFQRVQSVPKDKGIIYVYGDGTSEVLVNDSVIGVLGFFNKECLVFQSLPGPLEVSTGWGTDIKSVTLNVEPNKQYYIRVTNRPDPSSMIPFKPHKQWIWPEQVVQEEALAELKECNFGVPGIGLAREITGYVAPGISLRDCNALYIDIGEEKRETTEYIAECLRSQGYEVKMGLIKDMPSEIQCMVKSEETWFWDMGSYLLELYVEIQDAKTNAVYASATVERANPQGRRGPKIMANEAINAIFNRGMPIGIEMLGITNSRGAGVAP